MDNIEKLEKACKCLRSPKYIRIMDLIKNESVKQNIGSIEILLRLSQSNASQACTTLENCGLLIKDHSVPRNVFVRVNWDLLRHIEDLLDNHYETVKQ